MKSLRFDIYLPLYYNEKDSSGQRIPVEPEKFPYTFNEITRVFGGCSAEENLILGSWIKKETNEQIDDQNRVYHVVVDLTVDNLQRMNAYQKVLEERFRQYEIFMFYIHVYRF